MTPKSPINDIYNIYWLVFLFPDLYHLIPLATMFIIEKKHFMSRILFQIYYRLKFSELSEIFANVRLNFLIFPSFFFLRLRMYTRKSRFFATEYFQGRRSKFFVRDSSRVKGKRAKSRQITTAKKSRGFLRPTWPQVRGHFLSDASCRWAPRSNTVFENRSGFRYSDLPSLFTRASLRRETCKNPFHPISRFI